MRAKTEFNQKPPRTVLKKRKKDQRVPRNAGRRKAAGSERTEL